MSEPERGRAVTRADLPFAVAALLSGAFVLYLGRSLTFWIDEWDFIMFSESAENFLRPYNEHWSTLPLLLYRGTFHVVGLHSYLPYLAEVIALHLGAVAGAYALLRARLGSFLATLLCLPLLLLGVGSENLFWGFQTGFILSVLTGVWALVALERPGNRRMAIAALLLLCAVMSSGMGLFFVVAAFCRTAFDPDLRRSTLAVAPTVLTYAIWHALYGNDAVDRAGLGDLSAVLDLAGRGIGHAVEVMLALETLPTRELLGLVVFAGLGVVTALDWLGGRRRALAVACLVGLVATYFVIGLVREAADLDHWNRSRYVYVAVFFLVLALGDLTSRQGPADRPAPRNKVAGFAVVVVAAWALVANLDALDRYRALHQHRADVTRAFIALATSPESASWVDPAARLEIMPSVQEFREVVQRHGTPLEDRIVPSVVKAPSSLAREQATVAIVGNGFRVEPASGAGMPIPIEIERTSTVSAEADRGCVRVRDIGASSNVVLGVPAGARVRVHATAPLSGDVRLGHRLEPSRRLDLTLDGRVPVDIVVPSGPDRWRIGVSFSSASGDVTLCSVRASRR